VSVAGSGAKGGTEPEVGAESGVGTGPGGDAGVRSEADGGTGEVGTEAGAVGASCGECHRGIRGGRPGRRTAGVPGRHHQGTRAFSYLLGILLRLDS